MCTCNGEGRCIVCVESDTVAYCSSDGGATPRRKPERVTLALVFERLDHTTRWPCVLCGCIGSDAVATRVRIATHAHARCVAERHL